MRVFPWITSTSTVNGFFACAQWKALKKKNRSRRPVIFISLLSINKVNHLFMSKYWQGKVQVLPIRLHFRQQIKCPEKAKYQPLNPQTSAEKSQTLFWLRQKAVLYFQSLQSSENCSHNLPAPIYTKRHAAEKPVIAGKNTQVRKHVMDGTK